MFVLVQTNVISVRIELNWFNTSSEYEIQRICSQNLVIFLFILCITLKFYPAAKFKMSEKTETSKWSKYADKYDPIKIGSIDGKPECFCFSSNVVLSKDSNKFPGTDTFPHDYGLIRAINSNYKPNERVVGNAKYTIFIGRLHLKTDEV